MPPGRITAKYGTPVKTSSRPNATEHHERLVLTVGILRLGLLPGRKVASPHHLYSVSRINYGGKQYASYLLSPIGERPASATLKPSTISNNGERKTTFFQNKKNKLKINA